MVFNQGFPPENIHSKIVKNVGFMKHNFWSSSISIGKPENYIFLFLGGEGGGCQFFGVYRGGHCPRSCLPVMPEQQSSVDYKLISSFPCLVQVYKSYLNKGKIRLKPKKKIFGLPSTPSLKNVKGQSKLNILYYSRVSLG